MGQNDYALAEVWNGSTWKIDSPPRQPPPIDGSTQTALSGVSCTSTTACVAIGYFGLIEAWNGTSWRVEPGASLENELGILTAVSCVAANACTTVGWADYGLNDETRTLAERWNGRAWTLEATGNAGGSGQLYGVSCSKPRACVAVGTGLQHSALTELWNGSSWRVQGTPTVASSPGLALTGVSCTSPDSCYAVGYQGVGTYEGTSGLAENWNGKYWKVRPTPTPPDSGGNSQLDSISCIQASRDCEAVGQRSIPSYRRRSLAEGWNGSYWRIQATPDPPGNSSLQGVSCSSVDS
ncbi:MAG: hypothetical protein ACRD0Z_04525 [Acidimicrobiales bacterium]